MELPVPSITFEDLGLNIQAHGEHGAFPVRFRCVAFQNKNFKILNCELVHRTERSVFSVLSVVNIRSLTPSQVSRIAPSDITVISS